MNKWVTVFFLLFSVLCGCAHKYYFFHVNDSVARGAFQQAAIRLERCASDPKNPDNDLCTKRLNALKGSGNSIAEALRQEARLEDDRRAKDRQMLEFSKRTARMRQSTDPWDKYILFSELSAGTIEPIDDDEVTRVANEAFAGFGQCAKETDPSCMAMYGDLILRGTNSLESDAKVEGRRKALYWLKLAARYGYEPARKTLVAEGEDIPSPDLAMERLQKEANVIAKNTLVEQQRQERERAARDYELIRESRQRTEQIIWSNLFPKMINCTANSLGSYTYTRCW